MWGNKLGWSISGGIVVVMAMVIYMIAQGNNMAGPTPGFEHSIGPIALPIPPDQILAMNDPCDAADAYRDAIDDYQRNPSAYKPDFSTPAAASTKLAGIDDLLKSTHCSKLTLFTQDPDLLINYRYQEPELEALQAIGNLTLTRGTYALRTDHRAEAMKYYDAVFALGAKLFNERVTYNELEAGEGLMSGAVSAMQSAAHEAGDPARAELCASFRKKYLDYDNDHIKRIWRFVHSIDVNTSRQHVGDVFLLATRPDADHMWRVEATLTLGRYRWEDVGGAAQRRANSTVKKLAGDSNPEVRAAAKIARDLTLDGYRSIHG